MKKAFIFVLVLRCTTILAQTPATDLNWEKLDDHSDEFDQLSLVVDPSKWVKKDKFDHYGSNPQIYLKENVYINSVAGPSCLVLEVK